MANHQNAATLGVALSLETGNFVTEANKVAYETQKMKNAIAREMKAADKEIKALQYATEDYGKVVSKVTQIERELASGRLKDIKGTDKAKELLAQAAAYDKIANAAKNAAGAQFKMNEQQKIQLTYQTTDLFTQIASGQSPFIAILQQGGQLKDVMGGIKPMFQAIGTLITPFTVGMTAAAAAVGALAYSFYKAGDQSAELRDNLILTGNFAGTTQAKVVALSNSLAQDLSVGYSKANDVVLALVSSGKFSSSTFDVMSKAILQYSKLSGVDAKEAATKLMSAFDGTASSARSLNQQYNFLTLAQYKQIEALEKAGKTQEAIQVGAQAFLESIEGQERDLGTLETAWKKLGDALVYVKNGLLSIGRNTDQDKLLSLAKDIEIISSNIGGTDSESIARRAENKKLLQQKIDDYLATANKIQSDATEAEKKGEAKRKEQAKIADQAKYGEMLISKSNELKKSEAAAELAIAKQNATELIQVDLDMKDKLAEAYREMLANNKKEDGRATTQNLEIYKSKAIAIAIETAKKQSEIKTKYALLDFAEEQKIEDEKNNANVARDKANEAIRNASQAQTRELEFQKESLDLKYQMIYATETEQKLAQISLEYARKRKEAESSPERDFLMGQLERQEELAKMFVTINESAKRTQQVFDSVFGNLSSAIDNFVKTGKLSMKDLARSVIQDLIAIQMKAAAMRFLKAAFSSMFGAPANAVSSYGATGGIAEHVFNPMAKAAGGSVTNNTPYLVGERGPELFVPSGSGTIIPNGQMGSMGGQTINYNGPIIQNMSAIDTQSGLQFLAKNKQGVFAAYQSANRSIPMSR